MSRRGNVAMLFALTMPALALMAVGGLDISRATTVRSNLQDSLDAAALAAARSQFTSDEDIQRVGMAALRANLRAFPNIRLLVDETTFHLNENSVVIASAKVGVKTAVANIVLPPYGQLFGDELPVGAHSEVNRSTKDLEVSLVLDITGSMAGSRLSDLQSAANDLVDIVVQDSQDITTTRMALVPYSMGVNAGAYAVAARGAVREATSISDAGWTDRSKSVSGITRGSYTTISSNSHGFQNGDTIRISGVKGATWVNDRTYTVSNAATNSFRIKRNGSNVNSSGSDQWTSSGTIRRCLTPACEVVVTSAAHGLSTGETAQINNVQGMSINGVRTVTTLTADTFSLNGVFGPDLSDFSSRGSPTVQCLELSCRSYLFNNARYGTATIQQISTCVSERTGTAAYTDVAPGDRKVGLTYPGDDNGCLQNTIKPLTSNKRTLHDEIDDYEAVGSTAGQIGVSWGWYMVSPTFGSIFPADSRPGAYEDKDLIKVVILMTDGEFNTPYCNGVVARDAATGSGDTKYHINCNATNGNPFAQAVASCVAMKASGVTVYTVGFDVSGARDNTTAVDTAKEVMQQCATDSEHAYFPETGASLKTAFAAIGRDITRLRISK